MTAHLYRRTLSFLLRRKRQLCSNRSSRCSSRLQSGNAVVPSQYTRNANPLASIARRREWATIRACRFILIGIISQVVVNTTPSIVTFFILSPDASLSYDRIRLRLEEYRALLASDSNTIKLFTDNGKVVTCQKQAEEMGQFLDKAEILLRDVVQSHDTSTLVVLHHLRDLTEVLDKLKLYDECRLTGNCALDLAEALCRQSLEFRQEQAETLALIAGLSVYQPRARTLFTQAISICDEAVANSASHSSKIRLLNVLNRACCWASGDLRAQWLRHAIQLMTKDLPPVMVHPNFRSAIYYKYGNCLFYLKQYADAAAAFKASISIRRILARNNPARFNIYLAGALLDMGMALGNHGKYDDAIVAFKEVLGICKTMSAPYPIRWNVLVAKTIGSYGTALWKLNQASEAAVVQKQAISLFRVLAQIGNEPTGGLCRALFNYGNSCYSLGQHAESVPAYQESIILRRALVASHPEHERDLRMTLHHIANSFNALGKCVEADAAAIEALERNHGKVLKPCNYAPDFKSCFVCQRVMIGAHGQRENTTRVVQRE